MTAVRQRFVPATSIELTTSNDSIVLTVTMNSLRVARAALRARPTAMRVAIQRRGYAEAVPDKVRMLQIMSLKGLQFIYR